MPAASPVTAPGSDLEDFAAHFLPRLRAALRAYAPRDRVDDAVAETMLYLSQNAERVLAMDNPHGYLYRVARSKLRGDRRLPVVLPEVPPSVMPEVEPELPTALAELPQRQRVAVYLMGGLGWSAREVGEALGIAPTSVHNHYQRGLRRLRHRLGEGNQ